MRINPEPQGQTDNAHARGETRERGEFPAYVLRNLGGNITRARKRIEALEAEERASVSAPAPAVG